MTNYHKIISQAAIINWTGIVLDKTSQERLKEKFPGIHEKYYGHHCTLTYGINKYPENFGDTVNLNVIGYAKDDYCEAVLVNGNFKSNNPFPHITISTKNGIAPVYSNELLSKGYEKIDHLSLTGRISVFVKNRGYISENI